MVNENITFTYPLEHEFAFTLDKDKYEFQGSVFWIDKTKIYPKYIRLTKGGNVILTNCASENAGLLVTTAYFTPNSHFGCCLLSDCKQTKV
jgi:hypothetical protein